MVQQYVDHIFLLNEKEIADGMVFMQHKHRMMIEGAAASGIGAILNKKVTLGSHVVVIISGCSVDTSVLVNLVKQYRSEEHTSELQSRGHIVCSLLLEKKKCE